MYLLGNFPLLIVLYYELYTCSFVLYNHIVIRALICD